VDYFGLTVLPTMDELTGLLDEAGFGTVYGLPLEDGMKGAHFGDPGNGYDIYYQDALWEGDRDHTILHETYETLCDLECDAPPDRRVCPEADRFAAAVPMQPEIFAYLAECSGLDIVALQKHFGRSYASVTLRLAEVMRRQPLLAVLCERREEGDPQSWGEAAPESFRATVVVRTPGFKPRASRLLGGFRGGIPIRGRSLSPGSLAEQVIIEGGMQYDEDGPFDDVVGGRLAAAAQPVVWNGCLAKVVVVAVPYGDRAVLQPQLSPAGCGALTPVS
jgi:hypothetical protein